MACANASHEPVATHSSSSDNPSANAAAGQPHDGEPAAPGPTWCEVRVVLENSCQRCHGPEPSSGAPFSLVTYEDTQAQNKKGTPRFEAIASALESELMPPTYLELEPPVAPLRAEDRALLLAWCEQGAPADAAEDCDADD